MCGNSVVTFDTITTQKESTPFKDIFVTDVFMTAKARQPTEWLLVDRDQMKGLQVPSLKEVAIDAEKGATLYSADGLTVLYGSTMIQTFDANFNEIACKAF